MSHLADVIVFIIDASETCGYSLKDQEHLLQQMQEMFSKSVFVVVENKTDVKKTRSSNLKISCETGEGIDYLKDKILDFDY
jgi:nucleolar GTP-binding protein